MLWLKHRHSLAASLLLCSHVFFADGCRGSGGASCPRAVSEHAATVRCSGAFAGPRGGAVVETGPSRRFVGRGHGLQTRGASPAMPMLDSLVLQVSFFSFFFFPTRCFLIQPDCGCFRHRFPLRFRCRRCVLIYFLKNN